MADDKGALRNKIRDLIAMNRTEEALQILAKAQLSKLDKEVIILESRYNKLQQDIRLGILDHSDANREINSINTSLIDLANRVQDESEDTAAKVGGGLGGSTSGNWWDRQMKVVVPLLLLLIAAGAVITWSITRKTDDGKPTVIEPEVIEEETDDAAAIPLTLILPSSSGDAYTFDTNIPENMTLAALKETFWMVYDSAIARGELVANNVPGQAYRPQFHLTLDGRILNNNTDFLEQNLDNLRVYPNQAIGIFPDPFQKTSYRIKFKGGVGSCPYLRIKENENQDRFYVNMLHRHPTNAAKWYFKLGAKPGGWMLENGKFPRNTGEFSGYTVMPVLSLRGELPVDGARLVPEHRNDEVLRQYFKILSVGNYFALVPIQTAEDDRPMCVMPESPDGCIEVNRSVVHLKPFFANDNQLVSFEIAN